MASFLTDLFTSIFVPGPTHSLLVATNVSFAALQTVLLILLLLTYSIHFIVLSVLCAGLWWSINWFAAEVEVARQEKKEQEAKDQPDVQRQRDGATEEDSSTETESGDGNSSEMLIKPAASNVSVPSDTEKNLRKRRSQGSSTGDLSTDSEWDKVEEADT
ncbi:MAG: hypothetical protein Q9219_000912 [cf. Caloplaca sp. 3 TL-2023]